MTKRKKSCKGCACAAWDCFTRKWRGMTDSIRCCYCIRHKHARIEDRFVHSSNNMLSVSVERKETNAKH